MSMNGPRYRQPKKTALDYKHSGSVRQTGESGKKKYFTNPWNALT
jgi:hypothetical protein